MQIVTPEVLTASWQVFVLSKPGHGWLGLARIGHGWPSAAVRKEPAHWQSCLEAVSAGGRNKQQSAASSQRSFSHLLETSRQTEIYRILTHIPDSTTTIAFTAPGNSIPTTTGKRIFAHSSLPYKSQATAHCPTS